MPNLYAPRAALLALLGPGLACASAARTESPARAGQCRVQTVADNSIHVASEADGYALDLPPGFAVDCEFDGAFAELGLLSADYEQPSVGLVNVLLMVVPAANAEHAHDTLLEQFRGLDTDSFGIPADTFGMQTITAGPEGRALRCYGGATSGDFEAGHYYACTSIEQRADGAVLGSVIRVFASSEEWRINGDSSVHMIQALSRAWTLSPTAAPKPAPPSQAPAIGCAQRFGVEPQALASACGFGPLIAQHELSTYCELQYSTSAGQPDALVTLREFRNRDADAAWSLHRAGFGDTPEQTIGELPGIPGSHWSAFEGYRWSYLPGWTHARRIGWFEADCAPERMMPVLATMAKTPQPTPESAPRWLPSSAVSESLASRYGARTDLERGDLGPRELPYRAKKLIITLLAGVARNDAVLVRGLLAADAGFGMPDRREFDAWPIAEGDNFATFMAALRGAASRFGADAAFTCPPIQAKFTDAVARGEHPMWCSFTSADKFDLLVFRLLVIDAVAYVDYVGMFETQPTSEVPIPVPELSDERDTEPPIPPITPDAAPQLPAPTRDPVAR